MHLYDHSTYKTLFTLTNAQIKTLEDLVNSEPPESWEKNTYRQDKRGAHKDTKSIIFKFIFKDKVKNKIDFNDSDFITRYSIINEIFTKTAEVLNLKKYKVDRYLLAKLPAGKSIPSHKDNPGIFGFSHRVHVPIITAPECSFRVRNELIPMNKGDAIEINNLESHSVDNKSSTDRVHLIIDIKEDLS